MKIFLLTRKASWCEDDAVVVIAKDALHAERLARWNSFNFKKEKDIKIKEFSLDEERVVLISNVGG